MHMFYFSGVNPSKLSQIEARGHALVSPLTTHWMRATPGDRMEPWLRLGKCLERVSYEPQQPALAAGEEGLGLSGGPGWRITASTTLSKTCSLAPMSSSPVFFLKFYGSFTYMSIIHLKIISMYGVS